MRLFERYIGTAVQTSVLAVLAVTLVLFGVINYINEFERIGQADYTNWLALQYVLLWMPKIAVQIFPMAALLGTMLGLGLLAHNSELVVIRAAGVSKYQIALSVIKSMLLLVAAVFFVSEVVAPPAEQYAEQMRIKAMESRVSLHTEYGLWVRDGSTFVHIRTVGPERELIDVDLAVVDDNRELVQIVHAASAKHDGNQWKLYDVAISHLSHDGVRQEHLDEKAWDSLLAADIVDTVSFNPDTLSIMKQFEYINYLKSNGLNSRVYELAMWNKIFSPLTILAMVLLAVPFMFGLSRQTTLGKQVMFGFLIGIVFFIGNRLMGQMGLVYNIPPALSASIPTLFVFGLALFLFRRS